MKIFFLTILVLVSGCSHSGHNTTNATSIAGDSPRDPACGIDDPNNPFRSSADPAVIAKAQSAPLVCELSTSYSEGQIGEFASQRCGPDSPSYFLLSLYDQAKVISQIIERSPGTFEVVTSSSLRRSIQVLDHKNERVAVNESIMCKHNFPPKGKVVNKIADFECRKDVTRAIWSKLVGDFHARRVELGLPASVETLQLDITPDKSGENFRASNVTLNGTKMPRASGSATVTKHEKGCKVVKADGRLQ
ncbi:MAG: hypothetical protein V4736_12095 [Bdellovibrionota bacterium]